MLTPKQYQLIGNLTLHFNEIELVIQVYFPYLVGAHEDTIGELIVSNEPSFSSKVELLRKVLKELVTGLVMRRHSGS
jgi:hypothetical protein